MHLLAVWLSASPAPSLGLPSPLWTRALLLPSLRGLAQELPPGAAVLGRCQNPGTLAPPLSPAGSPGMAAPRPLSRATPVSGPTCRSLGQGMLAGGAHFPPRTPYLLQRPRARAFLGCTPPRAFTQAPLAGWSVLPAEGPVTLSPGGGSCKSCPQVCTANLQRTPGTFWSHHFPAHHSNSLCSHGS